ncbi:hypothetical protein V8C44DRAFT_319425 [Trichoderma aethiopicum]
MTSLPDAEPDDESTQPFSSPGPSCEYQPPNHAAPPIGEPSRGVEAGGGSFTVGGEQAEASEIKISCLKNTVSWRDINDQARRSDHINFDVYSDASTNTAFAKLYCDFRFKGNNVEPIFLFIHPETIRSVTFKSNVDLPAPPALQFSLTQPPLLIVPRDRILQCKPQTKGLLGLMRSLAEVASFAIQLNKSLKTASILSSLERFVQLFSVSTHRPLTNGTYASIASLYGGRGGIVVNANAAAATQSEPEESGEAVEAGEASLPEYTESASGKSSLKRQRKDSSPSRSRSPAPHERMLLLLESMYTSISRMESRLDSMEGRLDSMEGRLHGMEGRFGQLDSRLGGMESRFEELEANVLNAIESNYTPCRYNTEERADFFEEIHEQVEDRTLEMKLECEEMLKEVEKDTERAIEELQEEVKETLEQLEESVEENTERLVKQGLRTKLENASLRFDGTVFLDT